MDKRAGRFARMFAKTILDAARRAMRAKRVMLESDLKLDEALDELVELMALAYVTAIKDVRRNRPKQIMFAYVAVAVRRAADELHLGLPALKGQLKPIAAKEFRGALRDARAAVNDEIREAIKRGLKLETAVRRVTKRLADMGYAPSSPSGIETLVRTADSIAYNAAAYKEHMSDDAVWGFEYVTMRDDRVRPEHEELDGLKRDKEDPIWDTIWPPNGYNCRCQVVPIYERVRRTRAPNSPKVSEEFDFNPGALLS